MKILLLNWASKVDATCLSQITSENSKIEYIIAESSIQRLKEFRNTDHYLIAWQALEDTRLPFIDRAKSCLISEKGDTIEHLTEEALSTYSKNNIERGVLEQLILMAQRNSINNSSYGELLRYIKFSYSFFRALMLMYKPDILISFEPPHEFTDFILAQAVLGSNTKSLAFYPSVINRHYSLIDMQEGLVNSMTLLGEHSPLIPNKEQIRRYCDKLVHTCNAQGTAIKPYDESVDHEVEFLKSKQTSAKRLIISDERGLHFINEFARGFQSYKKNTTDIKKLLPMKRSVGKSPQFHYFPLHYEPEMTSLPSSGNLLPDQISVLSRIIENIGSDDILLIKEHPSQLGFDYVMDGVHYLRHPTAYRSELFYDIIRSDKRIHLVDLAVTNKIIYQLFRPTVWTITGTAAAEAYASGLQPKSIGLYSPWSKLKLDNSLDITSYSSLSQGLQSYMSAYLLAIPMHLSEEIFSSILKMLGLGGYLLSK